MTEGRRSTLSTEASRAARRPDPLWLLVTFGLAIAVVASEPRDELRAYLAYGPLIAAGVVALPISRRRLLRRFAAVSPVVLVPVALLALSTMLDPEVGGDLRLTGSLAARALSCLLLALALVATTGVPRLLESIGRLGLPRTWLTVALLSHRYVFVLGDEARRAARALRLRGGHVLGRRTLAALGGLIGGLFLRGWDRAHRVHGAMLLRGFRGTLFAAEGARYGAAAIFGLLTYASSFVAVRVFL